ncbi:hypothetical protein KIK84_05930 [Curvibacter sp. CHRR-16]|uniref:hypothetical protein n=1 Tax=Curvibacter sp. CHRR-16 TaxID=2835872 RepID=UPI001BDA16C8|nr:hypothetical protein [Curvibacter sp. CHRR-16]MBT0569857.1 hypothetical protein [Curvibacter sp. CHRR-16]
MHRKTIGCATVLLAGLLLGGAAQAGDYGTLYTQGSSNGYTLGYGVSLGDDFAARIHYSAFPKYSANSTNVGDFGSSANLNIDLQWQSISLLADWYPGGGGFRLTPGIIFNQSKITVSGTGQVNGVTANVNDEIKLSKDPQLYLGIGYGLRPRQAKGFGFSFDFGLMAGNPQSELTATGGGVTQNDINTQNAKVQSEIDKLKVLPVLGLGVSYSF